MVDFNFDGLVGPTHTFAGLAEGNLASTSSAGRRADPRAAALQGLDKMRTLVRLGVPQGVLPPHPRPDVGFLRSLGFTGDDATVLARAARDESEAFVASTSASSMWVANAATVVPSSDSSDGRVNFVPANLASQLHRSMEAATTTRILRGVFGSSRHFTVHAPLPAQDSLADEGAANHTRFGGVGASGGHLFVFGRAVGEAVRGDRRFRGRQTDLASRAVARTVGLDEARVVFARQHQDAIDAGAFHNDVIAVGHRDLLLCHELAFADQAEVLTRLRRVEPDLRVVQIDEASLGLDRAVSSYLFNSQLVVAADDRLVLIAPKEVAADPLVAAVAEGLVADGHVDAVETVDLTQSMGNGGGPACLRLRVELTPDEAEAVPRGCRVDEGRIDVLEDWVRRHYRDELVPADLADPDLLIEGRRALDELTTLMGLTAVYEFQD